MCIFGANPNHKLKKAKTKSAPGRPEADMFRERRPFIEFQKIFSDYLRAAGDNVSEKDRMEVTLQLAFAEAINGNTDKADMLLRQCESYILKHGKPEEQAVIYNIRCRIGLNDSAHEQALVEGMKSLYLFQQLDFPYFTMNTCICCGVVCAKVNLFNEAIDYLIRAHAIAMQMGDKKSALLCTANLNDIRLNVLPMEECIRLNNELLVEIREEYGDTPSTPEAGTYLQLSNLYLQTEKLELADGFADRSLSILHHLTHLPPHHFLFTNLYATRAGIAARRGDEAGMKSNAKKCVDLARLVNKPSPEIDVLFIQFRYYLQQKDIEMAKSYLDQAARLIPDADKGANYLELNENKCLYYHAIGDIVAEMVHFKLVHEYKIKAQQEALASKTRYMTTIYELEMVQKEAEIQKKELDYKTQELNMTTYYLQQRNELLTELQDNIYKLQKQKSSPDSIVKNISERIKQASAREEAEKIRFKEKFDEAQREFIGELHELYPALSSTECRICALLRSGFNTKEIAHLLSSSSRTIENHRATIRRKLGLGREDNLNLMLSEIK